MKTWNLSRRQFMQSTLAGIGAFSAASRQTLANQGNQKPKRPNIIFLLTDDQRWDTMGCMENSIIQTPNMDELATNGVLFTNAFVTTSICCTSRASIFIGKYGVGPKRDLPADQYDYWRGIPGQPRYEHKDKDGNYKHYTRIVGEQSLEFLEGCAQEQPFCLSVSFKAPHVQDGDPRQFIYDPRLPKIQRGQRWPEFALNIDIAPTILDLAGVEIPDRMQGRSLLSLVRGQRIGWRQDFFYEHLFEHPFQGVNNIPKSEGVVTKRFKYLRYPEQQPVYEELYNLQNDPHEEKNLAQDKEHQQTLEKLRTRCDTFCKICK
jgi:N-sulfoglucosamine sulfohydrolase-like protein/sulfatase-like protein